MANVLVVARGLPSLVYPSVELARRLAVAGHAVTVAGDPRDQSIVTRHGLRWLPLDPDGFDEFLAADAATGTVARLRTRPARRERGVAAMRVDRFAAHLRAYPPDLALINGEMHAHIIVAASQGLAVGLLNTFVSIWRGPGVPPPHHLARPGVGIRGSRPGTWLLWQQLLLRKRARRWRDRVRHAGSDRVSTLHHLARSVGFDLRRHADEGQWLIPFTYRMPVLALHAQELEFSRTVPGHVHFVGPMILAERTDRENDGDARQRLDAVLARRASGGGRRLIYAGFGSAFSTDVAFLRRLVGIVAGRPDWELVVSLSDRQAPADLGAPPERVHLFRWVPQLEVLAHADVAITHGGINSIDECITHGVPMLVYCGGETDMAGATSRVVHHDVGLAGDRRRDDTMAIRARVDRLLDDARIRQNVTRMQERFARYAQDRVAERTVDALLAGRPRTPRQRADTLAEDLSRG